MSAPSAGRDRGAAPHPGIFSDSRPDNPARRAAGYSLSENIPRGSEGVKRPAAEPRFSPPPPDPPLAGGTIAYLPRGVRLAEDRVRGLRVLQAPERAMQLDAVGEAILTALDGRTLDQVVSGLAAAYDAPEPEIRADVTAFLQGLIDRRMVFVRLP